MPANLAGILFYWSDAQLLYIGSGSGRTRAFLEVLEILFFYPLRLFTQLDYNKRKFSRWRGSS